MNIKERATKSAVEAIHTKTFQNKHKVSSKNFLVGTTEICIDF